MKVGDKVQFQIGEETIQDVIVHIDDYVVEGEKYDLTYVKFTIVEERSEYEKFLQRLTNETLRLNKGVQTNFDYENALKEIKSSEPLNPLISARYNALSCMFSSASFASSRKPRSIFSFML